MLGGRPKRVLQIRRHPPPLEEQLDHVGRDPDRLGGVDQGSLDRLLDPVAGIGAEARSHRGIKAFDGPQQAQVPFLDQVLKGQSLAYITSSDIDDQPKIGADHPIAGLIIALGDSMSQSLLLVGGQESHLVDLPEIGLQGALYRVTSVSANTGHEDPRCVGRNRVRSSQGSCGEGELERNRQDFGPNRDRRTSVVPDDVGVPARRRTPSLLVTPTVTTDVPGKVSVIPPTCPPWMLPRRLWPTIARLQQAGGMSPLRQEERNSPLPDAFLNSSFPFAAHASILRDIGPPTLIT